MPERAAGAGAHRRLERGHARTCRTRQAGQWAPAGFWQRAAAWTLDAALLAPPTAWLTRSSWSGSASHWRQATAAVSRAAEAPLKLVLEGAPPLHAALRLLADPALSAAAAAVQTALLRGLGPPLAVFVLLAFAWHVGFERSAWQGSPGKRALGLRVADAAGRKPALWRSAWRFLAGGASWLTLNLGHAMAALPPRRLALHDRLSGTCVLARDPDLPGWARAWLLLVLALAVAGNVWLLLALEDAVQAALMRVLYVQRTLL